MKIANCPQCKIGTLADFDVVNNEGYLWPIQICPVCHVLINCQAYEQLSCKSNEELQDAKELYSSDGMTVEEINKEVDVFKNIIKDLSTRADIDPNNKTFCDFGAGRGCASIAASDTYSKVISLDYGDEVIRETINKVGCTNNIEVCKTIDNIEDNSIDVLFMWHVIEHFPDALDIFKQIGPKLKEDAVLLSQVPCLRAEHVFHCHFSFYTPASYNNLCRLWGFEPVEMVPDTNLGFLNMIARRTK